MTNERQFSVRAQFDYFYRPTEQNNPETKASSDYQKPDNIGNEKQKDFSKKSPVQPVLKMLDSIKISPQAARQVLSNNGVVLATDSSEKMTNGNCVGVESRGFENTKLFASRYGAGNYVEKPRKDSRNSSFDDSGDACSDSTFSQSSELSQSSDVRSLNTTSSDSDNHHIYQQIVQAGADRSANKFNTVTVRTSNGFIIDLDVEVTRTVVMLMKIILWLRQKYPKLRVIYAQPKMKIYRPLHQPRNSNLPLVESSSDESSSSQDTIKPKPRKRISFSPSTLLFSAVTDKSYVEAKELLESHEMDINQQSPSGQSLLHIAAGNADLKCCRLLLEYGANTNVKDYAGWSPLHSAIRRGNWKCAILLIEAGANFAEYAQLRILEYKEVIKRSKTCYKSMEIFV